MHVVRHLTLEQLQADRRVLAAKRRVAEASAAETCEVVDVDQDAGRGKQRLSSWKHKAQKAEVAALELEVRELRKLRNELKTPASRAKPDVIAVDSSDVSDDDVREHGHVDLRIPGSVRGDHLDTRLQVLEQVQAMLELKRPILKSKKAQLKLCTMMRPVSFQSDQHARERSRSPSRCEKNDAPVACESLKHAQEELQAAEQQRCLVEAAVKSVRPLCAECKLLVQLSVRASWCTALNSFQSWTAMDPHLEANWVLQCGSEAYLLKDCSAIVETVSAMRIFSGHLLVVKTPAGATRHLWIGSGDAGRISTKARSAPPHVTSTDVLKAAVGALPEFILCKELLNHYRDWSRHLDFGVGQSELVPVPSGLRARLRKYQHDGFSWLVRRAVSGFGCVLADDMGLGKTVQCIALLLHLKQAGLLQTPALVVAPVSLTRSWTSEFARWAPSLIVHPYLGSNRRMLACAKPSADVQGSPGWIVRRRHAASQPLSGKKRLSCLVRKLHTRPSRPMCARRADVCVTSYSTFRSDVADLIENQRFSAMLVDEAQAIKNYGSQLAKSVKRMSTEVLVRIAITGTPVENRASDLHSIFEFTIPGYLGSRTAFEDDYARHFGGPGVSEEKAAASLQRLTGPFMLRRLKSDPAVAKDLPPRVEQSHLVDMTSWQRDLYTKVQAACMEKLARKPAELGTDQQASEALSGPTRRGNVFRMLHGLRKICNHPSSLDLAKWPELGAKPRVAASDMEASGKTMLLRVLLEQVFGQGEKAVIFCQYISTVETIVTQIASNFGVRPHKLLGDLSANERAQQVQSFQQARGPGAMVLTLGVGGTGITLHAACHVIHLDRCYNPARENQGSDRVHRIGQTAKCVFVHRIICKDTFEERMDSILKEKSRLYGLTMPAGEQWIADLSDEQLSSLFKTDGNFASNPERPGSLRIAGGSTKNNPALIIPSFRPPQSRRITLRSTRLMHSS